MEDSLICEDSNDREEGEIVDDDLEDISDNSIIDSMLYSGKSVSPKEHLYALSLSSVSDFDDEEYVRNLERSVKHRRRLKRPKRRRIYLSEYSSDSDSNMELHLKHYSKRSRSKSSSNSDKSRSTRKLKKQLHKAVHVDVEDMQQTNSLQKRLQAMISSKTCDIDCADELPEESDKKSIVLSDNEEDIDNELFNLRAEALKTALINKFARKKRRKSNAVLEASNTDQGVDKENENTANDENKEKATLEKTDADCTKEKASSVEESAPDEDEDVLRAILLASISKKMTKENTESATVVNSANNHLFLSSKPFVNNNKAVKPKIPQLMPIKPLIINLGPSDSDSDSDLMHESPKKAESQQKSVDVATISNSVDKFLREQRAKVEAASSATNSINPASSTALSTPKQSNFTNSLILKSAVKLLPKNKQLEYEKLMQRLKLAEKRKQLKAIKLASQKSKSIGCKTVANANISSQKLNVPQTSINPNNSVQTIQKAVNSRTNNIINKTNNGSKVNNTKSLSKNVSIVNKTNLNTKKSTTSVNLANAGGKTSITGNNSSGSTEMLQKILKDIRIQKDGRLQIQENYTELNPLLKRISKASSDRKKHKLNVDRLLKELEDEKKFFNESHSEYVTCVKEFIGLKKEIDEKIKLNKAKEIQQTELKQTEVVSKIDSPQISIGDPNDIHLIMNNQPEIKVASQSEVNFSTYISPLVHNKSMDDDPLGIICPFEITGTCKDAECTFKHISK